MVARSAVAVVNKGANSRAQLVEALERQIGSVASIGKELAEG